MSGRTYTKADLAAAWESGYWRGTSHEGPLNDAAVAAKNPHKKEESDAGSPAKKNADAATETPTNKEIPVNKLTKTPATVRELADQAAAQGVKPSEFLRMLTLIPTPPQGFTPNYEFFNDAEPDLVDYSAPAIERPGYKILSSWTPDGGLRLWIDHNQDEAFTVAELQDLITTLTGLMQGTLAATNEG
ncbi:hypothetical protein V1639_08940 [Pseudarthrobacter sp. J75]|uniref:hypothetical protein n=1 Tax=Pseudarthrobacter sp. J75 TaxID=3116486 RepID=UPI002E803F11|nr:hypothetical protein [Pseudarthrobacter sp. J75]MEE2529154.1 hypothetical protein [Pseudarthrobacter sp. J75]